MKKLVNKKEKKLSDKQCYFCECNDYKLLDLHRIVEGQHGGEYTENNTISVCAMCHRKIHVGIIKIDRKYFSSDGKYVLHYWIEDQEFWK
jgi:hypothetical protein